MGWWWNKLALLAIVLLCFLATAAGLRALLPWAAGSGLRTRVLTYLDNQDSFDAIYLGSSYFAHGIDPLVVDPIISQELGRPFSSFNLAANALLGFETDHLIRTLLDDPPEKLRFVVIEAPNLSSELRFVQRQISDRTISWHTPRLTSLILVDLAESRRDAQLRRVDALLHLRMFARYVTNAGFGPELVGSLIGDASDDFRLQSAAILAARGFSEMGTVDPIDVPRVRRAFLNNAGRYLRNTRRFASRHREPDLTRVAVAILEAQVAFLESRGLIPIYVMAPILSPPESYEELARRGTISDLLSYASPSRHPELYRLENRWDVQHLSREGARLWSEKLGHDLAAVMLDRQPTR